MHNGLDTMGRGLLAPLLIFVLLLAGGMMPEAGAESFPDQVGSGYFRSQDTLPGRHRLFLQEQREKSGLWGMGPGGGRLSKASFNVDAHADVPDYSPRRTCVECHREHNRDMHMTRMNIQCIQCHRGEPIAGVHHYYSPLNPIRRHAYVCAKCHEGATPSFAAYVVHEPNPLQRETRDAFPLLYWAFWVMATLAGGVLLFFLPYTALWWVREWTVKIRETLR